MTDLPQPGADDRADDRADDKGTIAATISTDGDRVVVVTPDGMGVAHHQPFGSDHAPDDGQAPDADHAPDDGQAPDGDHAPGGRRRATNPADLVEQPAKVMRIGSMVKQLLEEVRSAPLDERGRTRLADIHRRSLTELEDGLAPELVEELDRIALPFRDEAPSDAELRIAQAQLVGWLEGLFHGIQTALVAQQMAAQSQLQQMRALPPGATGSGGPDTGMSNPRHSALESGGAPGTGQYL
ncbi:MAG: bacterial proteasome activator family protein [Dermatophilaceae bacterium]